MLCGTSKKIKFRASLVAQRVKRLPAMQETWVQSRRQEDPLEKEMATHSSTLAWRIPWMEEPGGLQSIALSLQLCVSSHVFLSLPVTVTLCTRVPATLVISAPATPDFLQVTLGVFSKSRRLVHLYLFEIPPRTITYGI